jgi:hypothetical protein
MKKFRLKTGQESFEVVDGKKAGHAYRKGKLYTEIPSRDAWRFEAVKSQKSDVRVQMSEVRDQKPETAVKAADKE